MASIRKRSGRNGSKYDVRFRDPSGRHRTRTFQLRRDAERFAREIERTKDRGEFVDPAAGKRKFGDYAAEWLENKAVTVRRNSRDLYEQQLRSHVLPSFADVPLGRLTPEDIRRWHAALRSQGLSQSSVAKVYRLLRAILNTAVDDELISRNPCKIRGAGAEQSDERPVATLDQVWQAAENIRPRLRSAVLLAGFCGLRRGELLGLQRRHIDLLHGTLRIEQQKLEFPDGTIEVGPTKTEAGRRTLHLPAFVLPELEAHLSSFVLAEPTAWIFANGEGGLLRETSFARAWNAARAVSGLPAGFRFHDLRHTANTLTAAAGASTRELMARLGHASPRAAVRYQHATSDRDRVIADLLDDFVAGRDRDHGHAERSSGGIDVA